MTRPFTRLRPEATETGQSALIDRYLGARHRAWQLRFAGIPEGSPLDRVEIELIDSTDHPMIATERAMLWHALWARDEEAATVVIDGESWSISPGDTVPVPAGTTMRAAGGQLGLTLRVRDASTSTSPPTHGEDRFFGHNRQTLASTLGDLRLCRWKLTQPLALAEHYDRPMLVMALARSVVIRTGIAIDQLRQGEIALIDPATRPIVTPDGLAYLLTIDRPHGT